MHPLYEQSAAISHDVIAAAIEVQRHFGVGLLESIYRRSLAHELRLRGHKAMEETMLTYNYKGLIFEDRFRADIIVDDCLIIEVKATEQNNPELFKMQLLTYLKVANIPLGLVINFGIPMLARNGIATAILKGANLP